MAFDVPIIIQHKTLIRNMVYMRDNSQPAYPKITIITPSLNQGQFIEATILSILSQKYPNLEYIVMDGGSSDNTLDILRSYSDRVRWLSEKDKGQTNAINKGLRMASGEILAYLNADDLLLPGTLEKVAKKIHGRSKYDVGYRQMPYYRRERSGNPQVDHRIQESSSAYTESLTAFDHGLHFTTCNLLADRCIQGARSTG